MIHPFFVDKAKYSSYLRQQTYMNAGVAVQ
jgi:hypothetical protein